ncbi:MAG: polysaccharide biosynthesis tyrosine autokinase [Deltaproteobacteria bacterium]|nr:polysaccharide biosynthesis tyrosine autokinase [Deltaproteobacteria bacterium]
MQSRDEEIHLLDYWRILSKRRGVAITFFCAVVGIVAVYLFSATPIYKGTAQLLFELERNQTLNFAEGGVAVIQMEDPSKYFNTQKEIVQSRAFADRVVRKLQLQNNPYFLKLKEKEKNNLWAVIDKEIKSIFPEKVKPANPFQDYRFKQEADPHLTNIVLGNIELEIGRQNNIMKISYYAANPGVAASVANGIAEAFIEHNLDIRVKPYRDAVEWLSARLVESRGMVLDTEKVLQQYKEGKGVVSFEAKENVITQQLQELISQLVQTESIRQEAEIRYNQLGSVIDNPDRLTTVPEVMNNLVIQGLRNEELNVKKQLSELSDKYGPKHPQVIKLHSQLDTVQKNIIAEARKMLNAAKTSHEIAKSRENSLRRTIDAQKQEVFNLTRKAIDFNVLAGESESNRRFYELLLKKYQEASLSSGINISNVQIVDSAVMPGSPVKPKKGSSFLLAVMVGIFGGVSAAFFTDYMDDTIKTAEDVDKKLDLPFLGVVPLTNGKHGPIFMTSDPKSAIAESFRTIRTGLMLSSAAKQLKVILVTSATPNEGKTTTAANLAVAMSQMGERVLIVDGDMRRHNLHELFGLNNELGISDVIMDYGNLSKAIISTDKHPNLDIISAGMQAPNPSELLGSEKMKEFIAQMRERYDRVILDSPPIFAFSDSLILSSLADGVIIVVWGGKTSRDIIQKSMQPLKGISAKILGAVLNKIDTTRKDSYYYPYYSYYYSDSKGKKKKNI